MAQSLTNLVDVNVTGRIYVLCSTFGIRNLETIQTLKGKVQYRVVKRLKAEGEEISKLGPILEEELENLKQELRREFLSDQEVEGKEGEELSAGKHQQSDTRTKQEKSSGYQPTSRNEPEKLSQERKPLRKLIEEDCVQLGLLEPKRAKFLLGQLAGKQPREAEEEVVAELRNNLHQQVRKFIRKDKGGPWSSIAAQEEMRLDITSTPRVSSLLNLARQIMIERDKWLAENKSGITGRLFGSRDGVKKQ
jgi:hypothetical protein